METKHTSLRVQLTAVTPLLLYGSDTWTLSKEELSRRLQAFHMLNQRLIMNIMCYGVHGPQR